MIAALCIVFLAWFTMKFYMDNSNDSETDAYVNALSVSATARTVAVDGTGHYAGFAPYFIRPFTAALEPITGAYKIRGFVFARVVLGLALYALAYAWNRRLGIGWLTSLVGLMLLSTSVAFAQLARGWELEKFIEPVLFLVAGLAVWNRHYLVLLATAALAAANRETGIFVPLVALAGVAEQSSGLRSAIQSWRVWACAIISVLEVVLLSRVIPPETVLAWTSDVSVERLVYVIGGLCLLPLLAVIWVGSAPPGLRRLFYLVAPVWIALVLTTDRLEQGAALLAPLALLFVPVTLVGVEQLVGKPRERYAARRR